MSVDMFVPSVYLFIGEGWRLLVQKVVLRKDFFLVLGFFLSFFLLVHQSPLEGMARYAGHTF